MTANRIIPYGYMVSDGETLPHPQESEVVRRIYGEYLGGSSFLKIARQLTTEQLEFIPGRSDWNKNRIKRILEDERYLGTNTYPKIIDEDMHRQAQAVKDSNNKCVRKSENPFRLSCPVECFCGGRMTRRHDSRRQNATEAWTCQNPECHRIIAINDSDLFAQITDMLNRLIENPNMIASNTANAETPPEVRRQQNKVSRQLDGIDFEKDSVKAAIFSLAAERFMAIDTDNTISHMLRAEFAKQTPLSDFTEELFKRTVSKIIFNKNGIPCVVLKNNQIIERGEPNASDSNGDDAA